MTKESYQVNAASIVIMIVLHVCMHIHVRVIYVCTSCVRNVYSDTLLSRALVRERRIEIKDRFGRFRFCCSFWYRVYDPRDFAERSLAAVRYFCSNSLPICTIGESERDSSYRGTPG